MSASIASTKINKKTTFFSSPAQIARQEELEAKLRAEREAEEEAAWQEKKETIAAEIAADKAERERRAVTLAGPKLSVGPPAINKKMTFFSSPAQIAKREELEAKVRAEQEAEEGAALREKKDRIATEKAE